MRYGIQIGWPDGGWAWLMKSSGTERKAFETREEAEEMAEVWRLPGHRDVVRVVEMTTGDDREHNRNAHRRGMNPWSGDPDEQ